MEQTNNIKVVIKPRPRIQREKNARETEQWIVTGDTIECKNPLCAHRYTFDKIYDKTATNDELYRNEVQPIVDQVINGYHGTIFAYGQTSSGKTYTMLGTKQNPGIIRKAAEQIFEGIRCAGDGKMFLIKANYFEIYNEKVLDLLNGRKELKLIELPNGELNIEEGKEVKNKEEIIQIIEHGNALRKTAETKMNVQSSRSHAILQIVLQSIDSDDSTLVRVLNLVDLAGSEKAEQSGATGERLKEASNINKSLLTLSRVIEQLSEKSEERIPYRDSKITRLLANALGGNSMTTIICAITLVALDETNNTLGFATRAKKIENQPKVNEVLSDAVEVKRMKKQISALETELKRHKNEIEKYQKMQNDLDFLNAVTIRSSEVKSSHRRQTWGGDGMSMIPVHVDSPCSSKSSNMRDIRAPGSLLGNDINEAAKCNGDTHDTEEIWTDAATVFKVPTKMPLIKRSLLAVPTTSSSKSPVHRTTLISTTSNASPIALDKDKRIKALEAEITELQHFQMTELELKNQEHFSKLQSELEAKVSEIVEKTSQLQQANSERTVAIEAKELAEQKLVSIQYEFEEHKKRAIRREEELVNEVENLNNDETVRILKEKLRKMTDKANSFETEIWQNQNKHTAMLEEINKNVNAKQDEIKVLTGRLAKMENLQKEYDDVSLQMMSYIEENDAIKKQCDRQNAELEQNRLTIFELQKKDIEIMEVKEEFNALLADYNQLEHNNNISNNVFNQARMTIDCFKKECDILRKALAEAEAILAQQELDNLKLQKSICDYNDTINASQLNETCNNNNNNGPLMEITAQLEKANAERESYASKLATITAKLSAVAGINVTSSPTIDTDEWLEKVLSICEEFINIESYLTGHEFTKKVSPAPQSILEHIQSQFNRNVALQQNNEMLDNELKSLKHTLNQMENVKLANDQTISDLESKIQLMSSEIEQLTTANELKLKNEIARLQSELSDVVKVKENIDSEHKQTIKQLTAMQKKMEEAKTEYEQTISNLQAKVQSMSIEIKQFTMQEKKLMQNINEIEVKAKNEIANLQKEVADMKKAKESIDLERKQMIDQLNSMNKEMEDAKIETEKTITNLKSQIQSLQTQLDQQTNSEKELKRTAIEYEAKTKNDLARLKNELDDMKKTKDSIDLERQKLADRLNAIEKKNSVSMAGGSSYHSWKSLNPKRDQSDNIEKLRHENRLLQTEQQQLKEEIDNLRKSSNSDRKKKRQSIHDDTRHLSGFDATMIDIGLQTDPVDQKCACIELGYKIERLTQEKIIINAKYNVLLENSGVNSLQREIKSLKSKIEDYKSKLSETNYYYDDVKAKYDKLKLEMDMQKEKAAATTTSDTFTQTEPMTGATFVEQMDWDRVNKRAETYKTQYQTVVRAYNSLKESATTLQTQYNQNLENWQRMNQLQGKYERTKNLCNNRFEVLKENERKIAESEQKINELKQNEAKLQNEMATLKHLLEEKRKDTVAHEQLKLNYAELKELHSNNIKKCHETANTLDDFKKKYGELKSENGLLQQQLAELKGKVKELKILRWKYQNAKDLLDKRYERMYYLTEKLNKNGIPISEYDELNPENNENTPNNK